MYTDRPLRDDGVRKTPSHRFQAPIRNAINLGFVVLIGAALLFACGAGTSTVETSSSGPSLAPEQTVVWQSRSELPNHLVVTRNGSPYRWRSEAVVEDGRGFTLGVHIERLDAESGAPVWATDYQLEQAVRSLRIQEVHNTAIIAINDRVEARDLHTGELRWHRQYERPALVPTDTRSILIFLAEGDLVRVSPETGDTLTRWESASVPLYAFRCDDALCAVLAAPGATATLPATVQLTTTRFLADGSSERVAHLTRLELDNAEFHGDALLSTVQNGARVDWLLTGEGRGERTDSANARPFDLLDEQTQVAAVPITRRLGTSLQLRVGPAKTVDSDAPLMIAPGAQALADVRRASNETLVVLSTANVLYRFDLATRTLTGLTDTNFSSNLLCTIANAQPSFTLVQCVEGRTWYLRALRWRETGASAAR